MSAPAMGAGFGFNADDLAREFRLGLEQLGDEVTRAGEAAFREVVFIVAGAIIVGDPALNAPGTPVDKGYARNAWTVALGAPELSSVEAPKGDATLPASGALALATLPRVAAATLGDVAWLANSAAHTPYLEDGRSKQAPSGFVRLVLAQLDAIGERAAAAVRES